MLCGLSLIAAMVAGKASADQLPILDAENGVQEWRVVTDGVMGGVSRAAMLEDQSQGRSCLRLRGQVSLENNGGFVQISRDLADIAGGDFSGYHGLELEVAGNGETYNLHLKTADLWFPWQSFRASFDASPEWRTIRIPFERFEPYRTSDELDLRGLRRIGIVAIGRAFEADLCVSRLVFYRDPGTLH